MTTLEVILLVAGFACLCISFFVSRKKDTELDDREIQGSSAVWTEKEEQMIKERVGVLLEEKKDELVEAAQDQMNQLCNDKIMAIDEFSRQLIEKIENNHQEVVFMYNMLNEKEKEIMNVITKPVSSDTNETEEGLGIQHNKEDSEKRSADSESAADVFSAPDYRKEVSAADRKSSKVTADLTAVPQPFEADNSDFLTQQIQKLYKEGKSVLEISKTLNVGQGEVDLIIALYGGTKR